MSDDAARKARDEAAQRYADQFDFPRWDSRWQSYPQEEPRSMVDFKAGYKAGYAEGADAGSAATLARVVELLDGAPWTGAKTWLLEQLEHGAPNRTHEETAEVHAPTVS